MKSSAGICTFDADPAYLPERRTQETCLDMLQVLKQFGRLLVLRAHLYNLHVAEQALTFNLVSCSNMDASCMSRTYDKQMLLVSQCGSNS